MSAEEHADAVRGEERDVGLAEQVVSVGAVERGPAARARASLLVRGVQHRLDDRLGGLRDWRGTSCMKGT